jgi:hypothetical protein
MARAKRERVGDNRRGEIQKDSVLSPHWRAPAPRKLKPRGEVGALEVRPGEAGDLEVRLDEVGILEVRADEASAPEIRPGETGTLKIRPDELEMPQVGTAEVESRPRSVLRRFPAPKDGHCRLHVRRYRRAL